MIDRNLMRVYSVTQHQWMSLCSLHVLVFCYSIVFEMGCRCSLLTPGGSMLTLLESVLLICLISMVVYWSLSPRKETGKKDLEERIVALERQHKELRNAIALLIFKTN